MQSLIDGNRQQVLVHGVEAHQCSPNTASLHGLDAEGSHSAWSWSKVRDPMHDRPSIVPESESQIPGKQQGHGGKH